MKGIVHDASGSGQTLFVEPLVAVELGNAWREAQVVEQQEVERILDELSTLVASQAAPLGELLDALARFDFWSAKARLAEEMDATRAESGLRPEICLRCPASRPHRRRRADRRRPGHGLPGAPRDRIEHRREDRHPPNARPAGADAPGGLHVPADPGSRLPVLHNVFADIGDEQSVAQSLSTFSGHLRSIVRITEAAGPNSLVLLDELGAGTDPTEGSALAQALLDHFLRAGALVAATTHYAELKVYAHTTPGVSNASVEFDLETLSPDVPPADRPAGRQPGVRDRRASRPAAGDRRRCPRRLSEGQVAFEETLASIRAADLAAREALDRARVAEQRAEDAQRTADEERRRARRERRRGGGRRPQRRRSAWWMTSAPRSVAPDGAWSARR